MPAAALLAYPAAAVTKSICRAYYAVIMDCEQNRDAVSPQHGKYRGSDLPPHQMDMGNVRMFVLYQLFYLLCGFKMIKVIYHILELPQWATPRLLGLWEILAVRRRAVGFPFQREVNDFVAVFLQQTASIEAHSLCPTFVIVVNVNKKDFHHCLKKIRSHILRTQKIILYLQSKAQKMKVLFNEEYLERLYVTGKTDKKHRFQPQIIRKYIRVIDLMTAIPNVLGLLQYNSLNYEKLQGDKAGLSSVRVNDQYRIEFEEHTADGESIATICNITDLSNHYK